MADTSTVWLGSARLWVDGGGWRLAVAVTPAAHVSPLMLAMKRYQGAAAAAMLPPQAPESAFEQDSRPLLALKEFSAQFDMYTQFKKNYILELFIFRLTLAHVFRFLVESDSTTRKRQMYPSYVITTTF